MSVQDIRIQPYVLKIKNPFSHCRASLILNSNLDIIKIGSSMSFTDKDNNFAITFWIHKRLLKTEEYIISMVPLLLGSGDSMNILIRTIPI